MSGEVAIGRAPAVDSWDQRMRDLVMSIALRPKYRKASGAELALLAEHAERTGLSPLIGQLYGIYRKDNRRGPRMVKQLDDGVEVESDEYLTIQTGIDGLRTTAQRTGEYEAQDAILYTGPTGDEPPRWSQVWTRSGPPAAAKAAVWKRGARRPTEAVAHWAEYNGGPLSQKMPVLMLGKVAEALALRKAFPADLAGLTIPEEFDRERVVDGGDDDRPAELAVEDAIAELPVDTATRDRIAALVAQASVLSPRTWGADRVRIMFGGRTVEQVENLLGALEDQLDRARADAAIVPPDADVVGDAPDLEANVVRDGYRSEIADLESKLDEVDPMTEEADALRAEIAALDDAARKLEGGDDD